MISSGTFRKLAFALPGTVEKPHFDKSAFCVNNKIYATLDEKNNRVCLLLSQIDQSVFSAYDNTVIYPVPNKWGLKGATYVELKKVLKPVLKDALLHAYEKIAASRSTKRKDIP